MKYCPNCKEEYEDGVSVCADCAGIALVGEVVQPKTRRFLEEELPSEKFEELAEIFSGNLYKAELLKGELEVHGIPSYIDGQELVSSISLPLGEANVEYVRLLVMPEDLDEATELLKNSNLVSAEELNRAVEMFEDDDEEMEDDEQALEEEEDDTRD